MIEPVKIQHRVFRFVEFPPWKFGARTKALLDKSHLWQKPPLSIFHPTAKQDLFFTSVKELIIYSTITFKKNVLKLLQFIFSFFSSDARHFLTT